MDYCFSEMKKNVILIVYQKPQNKKNMCENQGYLNPQVHSLPNNCSGNCEKCKAHHQEECARAIPEQVSFDVEGWYSITEEFMICGKCGNGLYGQQKYCDECGAKIVWDRGGEA